MQSETAHRYVELPIPPSANRMFKATVNRYGRRPPSKEYAAWKDGAVLVLRSRRSLPAVEAKTPLVFKLQANIDFTRDLDNLIKPTLDSLVAAGVIVDDRWICAMGVERNQTIGIPKGYMRIAWAAIPVTQ